MNRSSRFAPSADPASHSFVVRLVVGFLFVAAVPVVLWVRADPAAARLTGTAVGAASLLLVGVLDVAEDGTDRRD